MPFRRSSPGPPWSGPGRSPRPRAGARRAVVVHRLVKRRPAALRRFHPGCDGLVTIWSRNGAPAPGTRKPLAEEAVDQIRSTTRGCHAALPRRGPSCPPGLRPLFRSDHRGGGLPSPSPDGGLDEFRGVCLSRASSSAIRSRACASSSAARASAACDPASSACSQATSPASTSSAEPASSPGTPGRCYHPGSRTGDRRDNAERVPRGVGVDPGAAPPGHPNGPGAAGRRAQAPAVI